MVNPFKTLGCATALVAAWSLAQAQTSSPPAAASSPAAASQTPTTTANTKPGDNSPVLLAQTSAAAASTPAAAATQTTTTTTKTSSAASPEGTTTTVEPDNLTENGGVVVREFQGDDVGQLLRLLARQAKINMVVSEQVTGTVTMTCSLTTDRKSTRLN